MTIKYLKIWFDVTKKYVNIKLISMFLIEFFTYTLVTYLFIRNINLSLVISILLIVIRLLVQLFSFYKKLVDSNEYNSILLKPVDPLLALLVYKHNPADILILLPIIVWIKIKSYIVINQKK